MKTSEPVMFVLNIHTAMNRKKDAADVIIRLICNPIFLFMIVPNSQVVSTEMRLKRNNCEYGFQTIDPTSATTKNMAVIVRKIKFFTLFICISLWLRSLFSASNSLWLRSLFSASNLGCRLSPSSFVLVLVVCFLLSLLCFLSLLDYSLDNLLTNNLLVFFAMRISVAVCSLFCLLFVCVCSKKLVGA